MTSRAPSSAPAPRSPAPAAALVLALVLVVLTGLAGVLAVPSAPAGATASGTGPPVSHGERDRGPRVVAQARAAVQAGPAVGRPEATIALRDLFRARPRLDGRAAAQADRLLARPTDGARDPFGDGYRTASRKTCRREICVHWTPRGDDAPSSRAWVRTTLRVMNRVWHHHVERMGYRRPPTDGRRGGGPRFDVYLSELGGQGLFGYCAPERRVKGQSRRASGFCVLDDDFAAAQFGRPPRQTLKVTAAHEFFHAVQFGYDYREDPWLLESTAVWMEERFADRVDDNRVYLPYGQLGRPRVPLDYFETAGFAHYGNWVFWEFLSRRFGPRVVRAVIRRAGSGPHTGGEWSVEALRDVVAHRTAGRGLRGVLAAYSAGLTVPGRTWPEGRTYPAAPVVRRRLDAGHRRARVDVRLAHLTSRSVRLRPGPARGGAPRWVRVRVVGHDAHAPAAQLLVARDNGTVTSRPLRLRRGDGVARARFAPRRVRWVQVTVVNASTRYRCRRLTTYACRGVSRDDRAPVSVRARVVRTRHRG